MPRSPTETGKKGGLGKGLNSLLGLNEGQASSSSLASGKQPILKQVNPKLIDPNPHQPRKYFSENEISELAESIRVDGVVQPLVVRKSEQVGRYILIAGERRLRASHLANLAEIPVVIRDVGQEEQLRLALIENIQRSDLNVIEEAQAYESLINEFGLTQEQCARRVGKDRATVSNTLRLLQLPSQIQTALIQGKISTGHGKVLLGLDSKSNMLKAFEVIIKKSLSVRQSEKLCKQIIDSKKPQSPPRRDADIEYLAESLREHLKTKVRLQGSGSRGKIEISYFSASELERIFSAIGPDSI